MKHFWEICWGCFSGSVPHSYSSSRLQRLHVNKLPGCFVEQKKIQLLFLISSSSDILDPVAQPSNRETSLCYTRTVRLWRGTLCIYILSVSVVFVQKHQIVVKHRSSQQKNRQRWSRKHNCTVKVVQTPRSHRGPLRRMFPSHNCHRFVKNIVLSAIFVYFYWFSINVFSL